MIKIPKRMPSGIRSLDTIVGGGFPTGSTVLLSGEEGSGNVEFAYTAAATFAAVGENHFYSRSLEGIVLPRQICYLSFSRSRANIIDEVTRSFGPEICAQFEKKVIFKDFSSEYMANLGVPRDWINTRNKKNGIKPRLISALNNNAKNSMVILHSLNDIIRLYEDNKRGLLSFLIGIQHMAKKWDGLIYAIFTPGAISSEMEAEIKSCFDGILKFEWTKAGTVKRQRVMYFEKFRGLLPHIEEKLSLFNIEITNKTGFVVSRVAMLERLK